MKLRYLERWNAARRANANFYTEQLRGIVEAVPVVRPGSTHVYYLYIIRVGERAHFRRMLEREGIATGMHYPTPIHLQPAGLHYGYVRGMLPVAEVVTERIISLPMYPELTIEQLQTVVNAVKKSIVVGVSNL